MKDSNEEIFTRSSLVAAMATNCGYYHGYSVEERFAVETPIVLDALDDLLRKASTVLDYGLGVGRLSREILQKYPHVKVVGVDNSQKMLEFARQYIPNKFFEERRVELYSTDSLDSVKPGSVDLVLAVYVLMHISAENLPWTFNQVDRIMAEQGRLYVLNQKGRAVPREKRWALYRGLRKLTWFMDHISQHKQAQRMLLKLDNRTIFRNDGVDMQKQLEKRFDTLYDLPLGGHPLLERLTECHFSRVYGKGTKLP